VSGQTVTTAVEQKKDERTPGALIKAYATDFAAVLPSHIKPETWSGSRRAP
jgi:recombination protein RecT